MGTKIRTRAFVILIVVLACILGITGIPKNLQQLESNVHHRIQLGLDLKGGTNLILQVQVEDAVNVVEDNALERLKDQMQAKNLPYSEVQPHNDKTHSPPIHRILIQGVLPARVADLQSLSADQFPDWSLAPVPGSETDWLLVLKASEVATIRNQALTGSMDTIRRRVDALGVVGPTIAQYGPTASDAPQERTLANNSRSSSTIEFSPRR